MNSLRTMTLIGLSESGELFGLAADAADELLAEIFYVQLAKKDSPLTTRGFLQVVKESSATFRRALANVERRAEEQAAADLDRDWPAIAADQRSSAIARAQSRIRALIVAAPRILKPILQKRAEQVVRAVKRANIRRFRLKLKSTFTDLDVRLIRFVAESQTNFIRDEYGRRAVAMSRRARRIVADGIEQGFARDDISKALANDVELIVTKRSRDYFDRVSNVFVNRGRTLSSIASYRDEGITRYQYSAVLDARTSNICRLMHGKRFTVDSGLDRFEDGERLRDPERIADATPFVIDGKDDDGNPILEYTKGGRRFQVARVIESAVGRRGEIGRFSQELSTAQLRGRGIQMPPLHFLCRSTVVPVI